MFTLEDKDVEFYLPQVVNMYVQHHEVAGKQIFDNELAQGSYTVTENEYGPLT